MHWEISSNNPLSISSLGNSKERVQAERVIGYKCGALLTVKLVRHLPYSTSCGRLVFVCEVLCRIRPSSGTPVAKIPAFAFYVLAVFALIALALWLVMWIYETLSLKALVAIGLTTAIALLVFILRELRRFMLT